MTTLSVQIGSRIRILQSHNPARIGKLATIIGARRLGRSVVTGLPNYVHPVCVDGVGDKVNGRPIAIEDGTFEVISGSAAGRKSPRAVTFPVSVEGGPVAEVIEFPNSYTPQDRAECEHAIGVLEQLADRWAVEVDLPAMSKMLAHTSRLAPHAPDKVREEFIARQEALISRMIEQAWIEGALHGSTGAFDAVRAGYVPSVKQSK